MKTHRGFSLTETALALALISVALVSLMGLLAVVLTRSRDVSRETVLGSVSRQVVDQLRVQKFGDLPFRDPGNGTAVEPKDLVPVWFDDEGQWLEPERGKWPEAGLTVRPARGVYQANVRIEPDGETLTPTVVQMPKTKDRVNLLRVRITLASVDAASSATSPNNPPPPAEAVVFHATLPRR